MLHTLSRFHLKTRLFFDILYSNCLRFFGLLYIFYNAFSFRQQCLQQHLQQHLLQRLQSSLQQSLLQQHCLLGRQNRKINKITINLLHPSSGSLKG